MNQQQQSQNGLCIAIHMIEWHTLDELLFIAP